VYDDLYRLIEAKGQFQGNPEEKRNYTLSMSYDGIHNITRKNQKDLETEYDHIEDGKRVGTHVDVEEKTTYDWTYQYGSSHPHAPTKIGRRIYTYDLNGNQLGWTYPPEPDHGAGSATDTTTQGTGHVSGPGRHLLWDEENRLQEYETEEHETYYTYNDKGERVYKNTEDDDHTFYLNQYYIVRNDAIVSKHLFAGATRIVTRLVEPPEEDSEDAHQDKLYFYHPDHLGSTGYTTNRRGRVNEHHEYFPFGETWIEQEGDSKRPMYLYTGKELDQESGLYYFGARYYDPRTSVWQSADPILNKYLPTGDKEHDQHLPGMGGIFETANSNLYGYVSNNPVKFLDPDGQEKARNWQDAENKAARILRSQGHIILGMNGKISATRDGYVFERDYDIVSMKGGKYHLTEVKFNSSEEGRKSNVRKLSRRLNPLSNLESAAKIFRAGTTVAQLHNDMLDSDITLKGKGLPGGKMTLSEKEGEVNISWQLWSNKKDQTVLNLSTIKNSAHDSEIRKEAAEALHKAMSVQ
jgi:RHS repeat-associated protein